MQSFDGLNYQQISVIGLYDEYFLCRVRKLFKLRAAYLYT